MEIEEEKL